MRDVSPLRQAGDFGGCTKTCAMMHDVSPLRQAGDFGGSTKTCAMMRDVSPLRQAVDFGGCTKNLRHDAWCQPSPPTPTKQARERMALNLLKISGLMQCPPLGFPYKEGCLKY